MDCRPAPLVAFGGGGGLLRAVVVHGLPVVARLLAFFRSFTLSPCVCPSVRILPRFRACFGRSRVWRAVVRFAVSILTPFFAVSRLVSARLVYSVKAIKKARFRGNFQGVFAFVRSGVMPSGGQDKKTIKKRGFAPSFVNLSNK